jgi:glycosyltransferase involved in cell wall biosynthesis
MHYPFNKRNYFWHGIPVESLVGKNKKGLYRIPLYIKTWFSIKRFCYGSDETLVLSIFATEAALVASYFCRFYKLKHFCWIMGQDAKSENRFIPLLSKQTEFLVMSEFLKQTFEANFKKKILGIVPSALYLPELPAYVHQNRTLDLIAVGSLIPLKRFEWVLQLLHDLKKEGIKAKGTIVGEGPEKGRLQDKALLLGVHEHVRFLGEIPQNKVIETMMKSKLLVHPSSYEGFGNVLIEGLHAGCHVVSLFNPLPSDVGQMHQVNSYPAFFQKVKTLLLSPLQHHSHTEFNTQHSVQLFISLLKQA